MFIDHKTSDLREYMKTESGTRTVPIPADLCAALREERLKTNSLFVFHKTDGSYHVANSFNCFWQKNVSTRFGPNAKQTARTKGVYYEKPVTPHVLRHTFATRCFEAGLDIKEVQRLMGHATPEITLGIYTHYCEESRKEETFEKARNARSRTTDVPQAVVNR